ncbi:MAG: hypothetical protein ACOC1X_04880 [Promethearchaeota archaeon]
MTGNKEFSNFFIKKSDVIPFRFRSDSLLKNFILYNSKLDTYYHIVVEEYGHNIYNWSTYKYYTITSEWELKNDDEGIYAFNKVANYISNGE